MHNAKVVLQNMKTQIETIREMLEAWEEYFGVACDCRPELENQGHVCCWCQARVILKDNELKVARLLAHKYLYHGCHAARELTDSQHNAAFALGDGYGKMTLAQLQANELMWDWSHIRDSSDEAILAIAEYLKTIGATI